MTNERLTRVGPGTPMGALLRRYWQPVATVAQLRARPTRRVRVLGEDLVVFRDAKGRFGLVEERCPHRGASLAHGIPDPEGLRCAYHGWLFDHGGQCRDQPCELAGSRFAEKVRTTAYPVRAQGGLLFAHLGGAPVPALPSYDLFAAPGRRRIKHAIVPCNWFQIMENSLDPTHLEWLHGHYFNYLAGQAGVPALFEIRRHEELDFSVTDRGIVKRRCLQGQSRAEEDWTVGQELLFPNIWRTGSNGRYAAQIRVPIDDEQTWHLWYEHEEGEDEPDVPTEAIALVDEHGDFRMETIDGQDAMAWVTQGAIADRTREMLGRADEGIILLRRVALEQIARVERGELPLGLRPAEAGEEVIVLPRRTTVVGIRRPVPDRPEPR